MVTPRLSQFRPPGNIVQKEEAETPGASSEGTMPKPQVTLL
jgi:hypothetical protein